MTVNLYTYLDNHNLTNKIISKIFNRWSIKFLPNHQLEDIRQDIIVAWLEQAVDTKASRTPMQHAFSCATNIVNYYQLRNKSQRRLKEAINAEIATYFDKTNDGKPQFV